MFDAQDRQNKNIYCKMNTKKNHIVEPSHSKQFLMDFRIPNGLNNLPLVIFVHGIKGFKGWGTWNLLGDRIANEGHIFVKFNFSHNGTTLEKPNDFGDLEAFGRNNYMLELEDLDAVIDHCTKNGSIADHWDGKNIALIGHSRGGPICLVKAANDPRITKLVTWASVATFDYAWHDEKVLADCKENGVMYRINSRTKLAMPLYYQFYENYLQNEDFLNTEKAANELRIPWLIMHGTKDKAVPEEAAKKLLTWSANADIALIENADHTFGGKHPYTSDSLPDHSESLVKKTIEFLNQ